MALFGTLAQSLAGEFTPEDFPKRKPPQQPMPQKNQIMPGEGQDFRALSRPEQIKIERGLGGGPGSGRSNAEIVQSFNESQAQAAPTGILQNAFGGAPNSSTGQGPVAAGAPLDGGQGGEGLNQFLEALLKHHGGNPSVLGLVDKFKKHTGK